MIAFVLRRWQFWLAIPFALGALNGLARGALIPAGLALALTGALIFAAFARAASLHARAIEGAERAREADEVRARAKRINT